MSKTTERPYCRTRTLLLLLVAASVLMLMTASSVLAGSGGENPRQETQVSRPSTSPPPSPPRVSQPSPPRSSPPPRVSPPSSRSPRSSPGYDRPGRDRVRRDDRTTYGSRDRNRPGPGWNAPGGGGGRNPGRRPGGGYRGGGHYYWPYWPYWPRYPWRHYYYRGFYYHPYYYPYYYDYYYTRPVIRVDAGAPQGALDLDIRPDDTKVFLDGQLIGTTDDYDGWPRYLWLHEGTYELIFYNEGYQTIVREYEIRPDVVLDVEERMQPGESIPPEELTTARLRRERAQDDDEYVFRRRESYDEPRWDRDAERRERTEPAPEELDARADPGRVHLTVEPAEASIYLDGRFIGTGEELGRLRSGLLIDAGEHLVQVVHPKYAPKEETFTVEAGEQIELSLSLEI